MYINNLDIFGKLGLFCQAHRCLNSKVLRNQGILPGVLAVEAESDTFFHSLLCCSLILQQCLMLEKQTTKSGVSFSENELT